MEIIAAILGALVAVFIGAWINNIFTWKIKDKIINLDRMADSIIKIQFFIMKLNENQTDSLRDSYIDAAAILMKTGNILINHHKLKILFDVTWSSMVKYSKELHKENQNITPNKVEEQKIILEQNLEKLDSCVHKTRNRITSFSYMLKELFMNWGTVVIALLIVIFWLLFHCFNN